MSDLEDVPKEADQEQESGSSLQEVLVKCLQQLDDSTEAEQVEDWSVTVLLEQVLSNLVGLEKPVSSANVPYRLLRDAIFDITQRSSEYSMRDWELACRLFITLIMLVPIAFDEAAFGSVVSLMTNALRHAPDSDDADEPINVPSARKKKTKQGVGYTAPQFWKLLLKLIPTATFKQNAAAISYATANGFAQLLATAPSSNERAISISGIKLLTHDFGVVYRALLPVALSGLKGAVKTDFINLVVSLVETEQNAVAEGENLTATPNKTDSRSSIGSEDGTATKRRRSSSLDCTPNPRESSSSRAKSIDTPNSRKSMGERVRIVGFLLYCVAKVPEKADDRKPIVELIQRCMAAFKPEVNTLFVVKFKDLAMHKRSNVRLFVSDFAASLSTHTGGDDLETVAHQTSSGIVVSILCAGIFDKTPAVRVKALSTIANILDNPTSDLSTKLIVKLCVKKGYLKTLEFDDKVTVRKSFIHMAGAMTRALVMQLRSQAPQTPRPQNSDGATQCTVDTVLEWVRIVRSRTLDVMSSVRKAAIVELHKTACNMFLSNSIQAHDVLVNSWCHGILSRVADDEVACQEKCIDSFNEIFISSLSEEGRSSGHHAFKWENESRRTLFIDHVLSIAGDATNSLSNCIRALVGRIAKKDGVPLTVLLAFEKRILNMYSTKSRPSNQSESLGDGTWALFAECLVPSIPKSARAKLKSAEVYDCALRECSLWSGPVAAYFADEFSDDEQSDTIDTLIDKLFDKSQWKASFWRKSVRAIMSTIAGINIRAGTKILERCEVELETIGYNEADKELDYLTFIAIIGDCCTKLQFVAKPSQQILNFLLAMASTTQTSTTVRASAVLALCRVCLAEGAPFPSKGKEKDKTKKPMVNPSFFENFARTCIPLFVRELQDGTSLAVRNNCIIALSELCRRFTSIVERYATRIAARLADKSETIRCHVLGAIGSLLQESYLKVRGGPVFFRIALALLDESANVRTLAKYILIKILHEQTKTLLSTNIIELVYVLNGYTEFKKFNQFPEQHIGWQEIADKPGVKKHKRIPYEVFMDSMTQDQILMLSSRICSDILTPAVDGNFSITDSKASAVLSDALFLLQRVQKCPLISFDSREQAEEASQSQPDSQGGPKTKAQLIRNVRLAELKCKLVPLLLELRCMLEFERSPILVDLRHTLCAVLKPHRKQLSEVITDEVVRGEIEHLFTRTRESQNDAGKLQSQVEQAMKNGDVADENNVQDSNGNTESAKEKTKIKDLRRRHSSVSEIVEASPRIAVIARQCADEE